MFQNFFGLKLQLSQKKSSLMFESKARCRPSDIRPGWKFLQGSNALAYSAKAKIVATPQKSFVTLGIIITTIICSYLNTKKELKTCNCLL